MQSFHLAEMPRRADAPENMSLFTLETAQTVLNYHQSFGSVYQETPLHVLPRLADALGLGAIYLKDESFRFGLNAFKALGGSYAIGRQLGAKLSISPEDLTLSRLTAPEVRDLTKQLTVVTATDGNHGRGVAWTARQLGLNCVVYLPKGSAIERVENIRALGAQTEVTDLTYDDAVRLARTNAERFGWLPVQDTAWPGYEEIPTHIMQGYLTMALEVLRQLEGVRPTHLFLQAGVGSMAGAVAAFFKNALGKNAPIVTIVEPNAADCHYQSALQGDGRIRFAQGDLSSIMAGLSCGEPNPISWELLRYSAHFCLAGPEFMAADGMRVLSSPLSGDPRIVAGESGAATLGLLYELATRTELASLREKLRLDAQSRVLLFSTEGATDRKTYRQVVWEGFHAHP